MKKKRYHIIGYPNKALRKKARVIGTITPRRQDKIIAMLKLMRENDGIGLAAIQIGWNARVFVMNITGNHENDLVFINPVIQEASGEIYEFMEGCLSIPGMVGLVDRHRKVIVTATDLNGEEFTFEDDQLAARCVLHEIDHLDGKLFIDRAKKLYKNEKSL